VVRSKQCITKDPGSAYGQKTRYQLSTPESCVYVDKTGCNTNMKRDGNIGGTRYIVGYGQNEGGHTGVTLDIHFTVLAFTLGTRDVVV
jgi:hypothetical protein